MNLTIDNARSRLRAADPAATRDAADPNAADAQAMLTRILDSAEPAPAPVRRRSPQRRLLLGGAVATAAAAATVIGVVSLPGSHTSPASAAYAVAKHADGSVSVSVHWDELHDPAALNAELQRVGARTVVIQRSAPGGCTTSFAIDPAHSGIARGKLPDLRDPAARKAYFERVSPWVDPESSSTDGTVFTIHPDKIPAGDTLLAPYEFVPDASRHNSGEVLGLSWLLVPVVPQCVPADADSVLTPTEVRVR